MWNSNNVFFFESWIEIRVKFGPLQTHLLSISFFGSKSEKSGIIRPVLGKSPEFWFLPNFLGRLVTLNLLGVGSKIEENLG